MGTKMKLQVLLALVATIQAAPKTDGCVTKTTDEANIASCKCHPDCKLCVGADKGKAEVATACASCTDAKKELNLATKMPPRKDVLMVCNVVRLLPLPEQQKKRKKEV